jgi:trk system potassium uptake protein TrkH
MSTNIIKQKTRLELTPFQKIILSFFLLIIAGACILMLPISSRNGNWTNPIDALFTSTSAACVTGLVVRDTYTSWTPFGQIIILSLIQIGGLGVATMGMLASLLRQKKIGLSQRMLMQESISSTQFNGIVGITRFLVRTALFVEIIGAVLLMPTFIPEFGLLKGLWYSIFHSISAFCNAGFDLMGFRGHYSSLTAYSDNPAVLLPISFLIIIGGLGFVTWQDIATKGLHIKKYHFQTKIILLMTLILLILPTIYLFMFEYTDLKLSERALSAWFQSTTARTAGFNSTDLSHYNGITLLYYTFLMVTGGAPGSTAGGMKVTTLFIILAILFDYFHGTKNIALFHRSIPQNVINQAVIVFILYLTMLILGGTLISAIECISLKAAIFEVGSAIGTVGLSLGVTPTLSIASKLIISIFMFIGRVGGVTLIYSIISTKQNPHQGRYPEEDVAVG